MAVTANNPYTLGRGKMLVAKDALVNGQREWHDFAHILNFISNVTTEKLEHFNMRSGIKRRDKVVTTQITFGGSCVIDVPIVENIKYFFLGDTEVAEAQIAGTWTTQDFDAPSAIDKWISLGKKNIDPDTAIVVTDDGAVETFVEDTDFEIDYKNGLFRTLEGTNIVAGEVLEITGAFLADDRTYVYGAEISQNKYHVWFQGDPADGVVQTIRGYATLSPSGDLAMIGDDWQQFSLDIDFEDHVDYDGPVEFVAVD